MKKLYSSLVRLNSLQFKYRTSISFVTVFVFILLIDFIPGGDGGDGNGRPLPARHQRPGAVGAP